MTDDSANEKKEGAEIASSSGFLEGLYGDPLRKETMRTARYLVITSAICIVVVVFNVRLQSAPLIPLDFGARNDVLPMLLSVAVLVLLISFLLRAVTDLLHDRETALLVVKYIEGERSEAALASARDVEDDLARSERQFHEGPDGPEEPWWESYTEVREAADAAVKKAEERIGIRRWPRMLREMRKVLEVGVPLLVALLALVLSRASLGGFVRAIVGAFFV